MLNIVRSRVVQALVPMVESSDWLGGTVNRAAINRIVGSARSRPHPWSTVHDYVSWTGLTDRTFSARHLPAQSQDGLPAPDALLGLFRRREGKQRLCPKSTCLFPTFAQYLTDGFIRTRMSRDANDLDNLRQNTSNHEIDLCPLYGRTRAQTDALRANSETRGERGRLRSQRIGGEEYAPFLYDGDAVARGFEPLDAPLGVERLLGPAMEEQRAALFAFGGDRANSTPQVAMMNTLLLREHNRLAGELERRNPDWDDTRVFETARNVLIVIFIKIVVEDYINHIAPTPFRLRADPAIAWKALWNKTNWITTEFSLLYRWHALIPDHIRWGEAERPVGGTFMDNRLLIDAGLARGFVDMSAQTAGALGPFNTTEALIDVERRSIVQGRHCRLAPYADYRAYVGLPKPRRFEDISADPEAAAFLKDAYGKPDRVDFFVGLFAEDREANSPLPPLILRMVAVDAFSQALTNPLLSQHVFNEETFSPWGWQVIQETKRLRDIVARNAPEVGDGFIGMTRRDWRYAW